MLVWIVHLEDVVHFETESVSHSSQVGTDGHSAATNDLVVVIRSNFKQIVFNPLCLRLASLLLKKILRWTYFFPNMRVLKVNILWTSHLSNYMFLYVSSKFNKNLGTWGILVTPFISQFVINSTHVVWGSSVSLQRVTSP